MMKYLILLKSNDKCELQKHSWLAMTIIARDYAIYRWIDNLISLGGLLRW